LGAGRLNGFEALRQTASATDVEVQFEDGRYFARTENVTAVDGSAPKFFAFIAFDNMTKAKAFIDGMKNTTALRTRKRIFAAERSEWDSMTLLEHRSDGERVRRVFEEANARYEASKDIGAS
jgi:uncharacterized protein (DUF1330 family)